MILCDAKRIMNLNFRQNFEVDFYSENEPISQNSAVYFNSQHILRRNEFLIELENVGDVGDGVKVKSRMGKWWSNGTDFLF